MPCREDGDREMRPGRGVRENEMCGRDRVGRVVVDTAVSIDCVAPQHHTRPALTPTPAPARKRPSISMPPTLLIPEGVPLVGLSELQDLLSTLEVEVGYRVDLRLGLAGGVT